MRNPLARWILIVAVAAAAGIGGWLFGNRDEIERRRALNRLRSAADEEAAIREIRWFESPPDVATKRAALAQAWGTGDQRLDLHLARYVSGPDCSEDLRAQFATYIASSHDLLERWGHYWSWKAREEPAAEAAQVAAYFRDLLAAAPRSIAWREVLDLEALFALSGESTLALSLTPENWRDRFGLWQNSHHRPPSEIARPDRPLPEAPD